MSDPGLRIVHVEDSPEQIGLVRDMLEASDLEARIAGESRLADAMDRLGREGADLVLLDLRLPDATGLEGVERLHARYPEVPLIVLTNLQDEDVAARAARAGADDYLVKREITARVLVRAIRYARERHEAEQALRDSEERYALAVAGANDGIWDWDLRTDRVYFSPRWREIVGEEAADRPDRIDDWFDRVHPEDIEGLRTALDTHLAGRTEHFEHEHRVVGPDGRYVWVLCRGLAVRADDGRGYRIAGSLTDVTARKHAEEQLLHDALHDSLTKLPNRMLFLDRLRQTLKRAARDDSTRFAVLFLDLDGFKSVNDTLGHAVGDDLLVGVATRINRFLRPGDTLARLGGDEFAILLGEVGEPEDVVRVAERVHELLDRRFLVGDLEVHVSASIGVALGDSGYGSAEDLLRAADLAMYRAKMTSGITVQVFDDSMRDSVVATHRVEKELRRGVEEDELCLHYQPIVSLDSGRVQGFEALLRWNHPSWGLTEPDHFIHVAEESGLIVPIGWWVLEEAARRTREWQTLFPCDPPLSVSINLSGKFFAQRRLVSRFASVLERAGLAAPCLHVEITEHAVMDHGEEVVEVLAGLRDLGIKLNIDDFGTGYASLTYLQRFAYDTLKIDRSFVRTMIERTDAAEIVRAIVTLARSLGMNVIAEGVETSEQLERLRELRCGEAQGYWFSRPLEADSIGEYLATAGSPGT